VKFAEDGLRRAFYAVFVPQRIVPNGNAVRYHAGD